ncbi:vanadium-dependent haloperoxidase [Cellulomonas sp.]|uniref:vanadium-dependent haloperoxidase n=1 Tax=Cellulomonas sp. TaxID=40001 RepID=UPI003BACFEB2
MFLTRATVVTSVAAVLALGLSTPAAASQPAPAVATTVVRDWQRTSMRTIYPAVNPTPIPVGVLYLGFTSLAMHRAADAARHAHGSREAAVATAAHDVLAHYFPVASASLDADLLTSLAAVPDGRAQRRGEAVGSRVARALIAERADDGRNDTSVVYERAEQPGVWQPAPGGTMLGAWIGYVRPLVVRHPLPVNGPDPLTSAEYAADYAEVTAYGAATGSARTPEQTATATFLNANMPVMISDALLRHLDTHPLQTSEAARIFAVMHTSMADALITCWRLKYEVGFWRPIQAIAGAGDDGNPATAPQAGWTPLITNPPYSDYVSGHGCLTAPAIQTIRATLGESTSLTLHNTQLNADVTYPDLSSIEADSFMARIWGGLHFRDAMEDAYSIGHRAADRALVKLR